jgi:hypothetical protein
MISTLLKWALSPKRLLGVACAAFCIFWLFNGREIITRTGSKAEEKLIADFKQDNPKVADWLVQQQDQFGMFNTAVAIESLRGRSLNPEAMKESIQIRARLTALYRDDQANDESVLWSHGTAIDAMSELPNETDAYLNALEVARTDRDYWSLVRNDPVALTSTLLKSNLELRRDYRDNQDWYIEMTEVLVAMIGITPNANTSEEEAGFIQLDDLLIVANEGKPYLMELVPKPSETPIEACIYFETFRQFGEVISLAAKQGVPPKETAEVIILNRDALLSDDEEFAGAKVKDPTSMAASLVTLYRNRPSVWAAAQLDGYVLSFDKLTPGLSQSVLEKHADLGVASLIATQYRDVATQAAAIVDNYGELGVAVLAQYDGSENFRKLLRNANVDHRIAMVAVLKSDVGLESVLRDPAYIDKWIGQDGKALEPKSWESIPGGAIAKVAKNYIDGVPSDWSEIGWAAWDVADAGLLIFSFGTSKIATEAAKQSAKQIGKSATRKMTNAGIKRSTQLQTRQSAMARLIEVFKASRITTPIRWSARTIITVTRGTTMIGGKLVTVSNKIIQTAKNIPPGVRIWAARGLLGASLFVRGPERIRALLKSLNQYAIDLTNDFIKAIPNAITEAVKTVVEATKQMVGGNFEQLMVFGIFCISALFAFTMLFDYGPKLSFAGLSDRGSSKQRNRSSKRKK